MINNNGNLDKNEASDNAGEPSKNQRTWPQWFSIPLTFLHGLISKLISYLGNSTKRKENNHTTEVEEDNDEKRDGQYRQLVILKSEINSRKNESANKVRGENTVNNINAINQQQQKFADKLQEEKQPTLDDIIDYMEADQIGGIHYSCFGGASAIKKAKGLLGENNKYDIKERSTLQDDALIVVEYTNNPRHCSMPIIKFYTNNNQCDDSMIKTLLPKDDLTYQVLGKDTSLGCLSKIIYNMNKEVLEYKQKKQSKQFF